MGSHRAASMIGCSKSSGAESTCGMTVFSPLAWGERTREASRGEPDAGQADLGGSSQGKLLRPERRRRAVVHVRQRIGVSERHACRVLGQPRSGSIYPT